MQSSSVFKQLDTDTVSLSNPPVCSVIGEGGGMALKGTSQMSYLCIRHCIAVQVCVCVCNLLHISLHSC